MANVLAAAARQLGEEREDELLVGGATRADRRSTGPVLSGAASTT